MLLIILVQGFCPLNIKITHFPGGFRLNTVLERKEKRLKRSSSVVYSFILFIVLHVVQAVLSTIHYQCLKSILYKNLYTSKVDAIKNTNAFFPPLEEQKRLSQEEQSLCEGPLSKKECL